MQRNAIAFFLAALVTTACTTTHTRPPRAGDLTVRASGGVERTELQSRSVTRFFGQDILVEERGTRSAPVGRLELATRTVDGADAGLYLAGSTYGGDTEYDRLSLGAALRQPLLAGGVRPYLEVHGGARHVWVSDSSGLGWEYGGALGVETDVGARTSAFLQVGYGWSSVDIGLGQVESDGLLVTVGCAVRF